MAGENHWIVYVLSVGVFGILNTEMGFIGILPFIAKQYEVSITDAGMLVSLFALGVAIAGPTMPLLFSGINRKFVMLLVLGIFILGNIVSVIAPTFEVLLVARIIPAFFHPVYCAMAFSVAAASVRPEFATRAVSKVVIGVSAGMVIGVPFSNFLAGEFSLSVAMIFFAVVNILVFAATLFLVPSMPVFERVPCGKQVSVLKKPMVWLSILTVVLMNGAVFGVFNYLTEYLNTITQMPLGLISSMLFLYGVMNICGSVLAGSGLSRNPRGSIGICLASLFALFVGMLFLGKFVGWMIFLIVFLGAFCGRQCKYYAVLDE
jgi:MFS transporter, DHA1 family, inner membrane transport protein